MDKWIVEIATEVFEHVIADDLMVSTGGALIFVVDEKINLVYAPTGYIAASREAE